MVRPFVSFQADKRIRAHPFDLLSERGDSVKMPSVVREMRRNDIGLITANARQSAEIHLLECSATFALSHLMNQHSKPPLGRSVAIVTVPCRDRQAPWELI